MTTATATAPSPVTWKLWVGRVLSALPVLAMLMSAAMKLSHQPKFIDMWVAHFGYPESAATGVGLVELACAALYAVPRTRVLGAILVTVLEERDEPVVGASVQIAGTDLWPARLARTGEHGTVRIGGLAAGTYALRATKDTRVSPIELGVPLARGAEAALMLHLAAGRTIAVHVTDATAGSPVGGAHVSLAEAGLSPFPLEATTDGAPP